MLKTCFSTAGLFVVCVLSATAVMQARPVKAPQTRDQKTATAPQVAHTGVIAGVVVSADAGRPVRRARVSAVGGSPRISRTVDTNDQGEFRITGLPAGDYTITSSKGGYVQTTYGQKSPGSGRPGTPIPLQAGQELNRLTLALAKGGVITGTVFDDGGEPAFGTRVRAYKWVMRSGERTLESAGSAMTDDRGVYRIPMLERGEYVLSAVPQGDGHAFDFEEGTFSIAIDSGNGISYAKMINAVADVRGKTFVIDSGAAEHAVEAPATGFATIYYPGTTQATAALSVPVAPGEERAGVDFQLQVLPLGKMSGVVMGPDGPAAKAEVRLIDRSAPPGFGGRNTRTDKDGRFEFGAMQPGQYTLFARATPKGGRPLEANAREAAEFLASTAERLKTANKAEALELEKKLAAIAKAMAEAAQLWAMTDVASDGRELAGVQLTLQQGMTISGQVLLEAGSGPPPSLARMSLTVSPVGQPLAGEFIEPPPAAVDANGRFTIRGVMPGRYRIAAAGGVPSGYSIRSALFGGVDVIDVPMELSGNEQPSGGVVTFTARATEVSGVVQNDAHQAAAGVTLIAFAAEERFWVPGARRIAAVRPGSDGKYVIKGLPPGDYRVVAVDDVEPGQWFDPAFLRTLGAFTIVTVTDGAKVAQDIRVR